MMKMSELQGEGLFSISGPVWNQPLCALRREGGGGGKGGVGSVERLRNTSFLLRNVLVVAAEKRGRVAHLRVLPPAAQRR